MGEDDPYIDFHQRITWPDGWDRFDTLQTGRETMNIPACVRDGCETATIEIGEFKFEIDISDLNNIIIAARLELQGSLLLNSEMLQDSLLCMEEVTYMVMTNSTRPTDSESAKNLKRWYETGCGGYQDLDEAWEAIRKEGA
jgi:hypothetical protein